MFIHWSRDFAIITMKSKKLSNYCFVYFIVISSEYHENSKTTRNWDDKDFDNFHGASFCSHVKWLGYIALAHGTMQWALISVFVVFLYANWDDCYTRADTDSVDWMVSFLSPNKSTNLNHNNNVLGIWQANWWKKALSAIVTQKTPAYNPDVMCAWRSKRRLVLVFLGTSLSLCTSWEVPTNNSW